MKLLIAFLIFFTLSGIFFSFVTFDSINNYEGETKDKDWLGALYLKPSEKDMILEIRENYNGLIVIPETMEIYGKTVNLNEDKGNIMKRIISGWNK